MRICWPDGIQNPHGLVLARGGESAAVGAEGHAPDQVGVAPEQWLDQARRRIPVFTVLSWLAEARVRPSGLKATPKIVSEWPGRVRAACPVAASQTITVLSPPAEARRVTVGAEGHAPDGVGIA